MLHRLQNKLKDVNKASKQVLQKVAGSLNISGFELLKVSELRTKISERKLERQEDGIHKRKLKSMP